MKQMELFKTIEHAYFNDLDTPLTAIDNDCISIIKLSEDKYKVINPQFEVIVNKNSYSVNGLISWHKIISIIETSVMKNI